VSEDTSRSGRGLRPLHPQVYVDLSIDQFASPDLLDKSLALKYTTSKWGEAPRCGEETISPAGGQGGRCHVY